MCERTNGHSRATFASLELSFGRVRSLRDQTALIKIRSLIASMSHFFVAEIH